MVNIGKEKWEDIFKDLNKEFLDYEKNNNGIGQSQPKLIEQIITNADITSKDNFLDIGSGIGNVVFQMTARVEKCIF